MNRRTFLESLTALTAGMLLPSSRQHDEGHDRHGDVLPRRILGRTGEAVTMLGVGGWHLGQMNPRDAQATVEAAIEGGIRFFDSAESYQAGGSERYLGRFLVPKYRDDVFLMTKSTARRPIRLRRHLEDSLRRMNTEYLDLWQLHAVYSPADVDRALDNGVLDVMEKAVEEGKVRHIGFTGHRTYTAHLRVLERTDRFETCQMPINVADVSYESFIDNVLPVLTERNLGVIAMKTLSNGGFFGGSSHGQHGNNPRVVPNRLSIREALHFVWSLPVSVLITGPDNVEQLHEKIGLARSYNGMNAEEHKALVARVADMAGRRVEFYKA